MTDLRQWQHKKYGGLRRLALWSGAALTVLGAHAGAAVWLLHEADNPVVLVDEAPPVAIMIDMAAEAQAQFTEETNVSEQLQDSMASSAAEQVEVEEAPEEIQEELPEPEEPVVEELQEEPVEELPIVEKAEVALPQAKPKVVEQKPEPKPKPKPKPEPKPKLQLRKLDQPKEKPQLKQPSVAQADSQQATKAQAQLQQSDRTAAQQSSASSAASPRAINRWESRLMAHLERRKRYPPGAQSRGEQGTAYVRFVIDDEGNVLSVRLARSSGYPDLDNEVVAMVKRASPVPAPPAGVNKTITAPVQFNTRKR